MKVDNNIALGGKKKASLCNPSTTVMQRMDYGKRGVIAIIGGPRVGFAFTLKQGDRLIIGSSPGADIQLDCRGISRKHLCVFWLDDKIYIEGQQSSNGTFVNKRKITTTTVINSNDQIKIGATTVLKCSKLKQTSPFGNNVASEPYICVFIFNKYGFVVAPFQRRECSAIFIEILF